MLCRGPIAGPAHVQPLGIATKIKVDDIVLERKVEESLVTTSFDARLIGKSKDVAGDRVMA